jgi:hypothetical protein
MQKEPFVPSPERQAALDDATPDVGDFVLYCKICPFIGHTNAAHAKAATCPDCRQPTRIWRNGTIAEDLPLPDSVLEMLKTLRDSLRKP